MTPADIAAALPGRRHRKSSGGYMACCPVHPDKNPSLSIDASAAGSLLVKCMAGCSQGDVVAALRGLGLWHTEAGEKLSPAEIDRRRSKSEAIRNRETDNRISAARSRWRESLSSSGSLVVVYLRPRGIPTCPASLRYHHGILHPETGLTLPAMVAAVQDVDGVVTGLHQTLLRADGRDKAPVSNNKKMLGVCSGGAVRLGPAAESMLVGEGVESTLSAMMGCDLPGWSALSAHGMEALRLPPLPLARCITIAADNDVSGRGLSAAESAAARWRAEGRTVKIALPPTPGTDFNDLLTQNKGPEVAA